MKPTVAKKPTMELAHLEVTLRSKSLYYFQSLMFYLLGKTEAGLPASVEPLVSVCSRLCPNLFQTRVLLGARTIIDASGNNNEINAFNKGSRSCLHVFFM